MMKTALYTRTFRRSISGLDSVFNRIELSRTNMTMTSGCRRTTEVLPDVSFLQIINGIVTGTRFVMDGAHGTDARRGYFTGWPAP